MRRIVLMVVVALLLVVLAAGTYVWFGMGVGKFLQTERVELGKDLFAIVGGGGNTVVLLDGKRALVVDTKIWPRSKRVLEALREAGAEPAEIVNTHFHLDHTGGNPLYPKGTKVVATQKTLDNMLSYNRSFWEDEPARSLVPNDTLKDGATREIAWGAETVALVPLPPAHTDGDVAVLFRNARVVHGGDVFWNGHYLRVDHASRGQSAGSLKGVLGALDVILGLPADTFVPGHGKVGDRAAVEKSRAFVVSLLDQTARIAAGGGTVEDALAKVDLSSFALTNTGPFTSREDCIRLAWEEAAPGK